MAKVFPPPPNRDVDPVHLIVPAGSIVHRIYDPDSHGATATGFRTAGPFVRFDHHAKRSPGRAIQYGGADFKCCLVEIYGDTGFGTTRNRRHCKIELVRDLELLDLSGDGALKAGTITAVCSGGHRVAQRWSRYFYDHPAIYGTIDGIAYRNAHNEAFAYALYERAADALGRVVRDNRLDDDSRRPEYVRAATEANLVIGFYGKASSHK